MTSFSSKILLTALLLLFLMPSLSWSWDYSKTSIQVRDIVSGGPPKDGIPALLMPKFIASKKADFMKEDELVLGVYINGVARAFPTRILSWHELVNTRFGDLPVLVSW
jgi:hypothetical protein